jgi:putative colanic acid biosynthesis UDP-glucose lipid carrier transferase
MLADCHSFSQVIRNYKFRNLVKPGITGLAQVKGFHGPAMDHHSIYHRYQWDAYYVNNAGLRMDLRILRKTVAMRLGNIFGNG